MACVRDIKIGMEVAEKLMGADYQMGGAEHDIIYLMPPGTIVSEEDKQTLEGAHWHYSTRDGWYHHV